MKPLNYIKKYGLDKPHTKIRFEDIIEDFQVDFMALLEIGRARENIKGYENAIRAMHSKFEGIEMKSDASNRKAVKACWNKFYAVFVAPTRERLFPDKMRERRGIKETKLHPMKVTPKRGLVESLKRGARALNPFGTLYER